VVFLRAIVVGLVCGFVDGGVVLVVVMRGVLHVGSITALSTVGDIGMVVFPRADMVLVAVLSGVLHVVRVPFSRRCRRCWRCPWLCPSSW
jgi:hypothetical protein